MNRYALNSQALGAGVGRPLALASAFQALYLVAVAAKNSVHLRGRVDDTLYMNSVLSPTIYRMFDAAQTMSLGYHADVHRWVVVYGRAVQNFALAYKSTHKRLVLIVSKVPLAMLYVAKGMRIVPSLATSSVKLSSVFKPRTAILASVSIPLSLTPLVKFRTALLESLSLSLNLTPLVKFRTALLESFTGVLGLRWLLRAEDVPSAMAAPDRSASVSWVSRQVVVPSAEFGSGRKAVLDAPGAKSPVGSSGYTGDVVPNFTGSIDDLRDVVSKDATDGKLLVFNDNVWVPSDLDGGDFTSTQQPVVNDSSTFASSLNDVSDVSVSTADSGEALGFKDGKWVPTPTDAGEF